VSWKDFLSFLFHVQDLNKKGNSIDSEREEEETVKERREIEEKKGGTSKVESNFELHWKKRAKSGEGKLLMALALPFFSTIHSVHSLGKFGG
jgi:hypothetical protein